MKIIILDIDGVLATDDSSKLPAHDIYAYPFDKECVMAFNHILKTTDAEIVLSSDWRLMYNNDLEIIDEIFKHNGVIKSPIDVTPNYANREKDIIKYVESNLSKIKKLLILDDLDLKIFKHNFIRCNIKNGILQEGVLEKASFILNNIFVPE